MKRILIILAVLLGFSMVMSDVNADNPTKTYFRFTIPQGISYSPGWFGVSDKCPQNVTVVYYNDKEGYGLAYTTDKFVPKEVSVVTQSYTDGVVSAAKDVEGVYAGDKLVNRWLPEMEVKDIPVEEKSDLPLGIEPKIKKAVCCPVCGEFVMWHYDGVTDYRQVLYCLKGHKFVTISYEGLNFVKESEIMDK